MHSKMAVHCVGRNSGPVFAVYRPQLLRDIATVGQLLFALLIVLGLLNPPSFRGR